MRRVVIVQPYVPEYRVPLFEGLRSRLLEAGVALEIVTGKPSGAQRARKDASTLQFQRQAFSLKLRLGNRSFSWKRVRPLIKGADLVICELGSGVLENYRLAMRRPKQMAVWGHGYAAVSRPSRLDAALERWLMRRTTRFFAYTQRGRAEAEAAGLPSGAITVLNNTVDTRDLMATALELSAEEVDRFRAEHDLGVGPVCAYIGGLDESKRIDFLLSAGALIAKRLPNFRLVIGGDGAQRDLVLGRLATSPWLRYLGRVATEEKALLSRCASLLLNPGRVGLVAVDSFAMRTPIATTDWPRHAPEFDYLVDGVNALITEDTIEAYVGGVSSLLQSSADLERLSNGCGSAAQGYSIEEMIERYAQGILQALGSPTLARAAPPLALFVWGNWGPYHYARFRAASDYFCRHGLRAEGLELFSTSGVYEWRVDTGDDSVAHLGFPPPESRFRPWSLTTKALPYMRSKRPDVIFVPSYIPWSLFLNVAARMHGARVVMMNDTHATTAHSGGFRLSARRFFVRNFHAAFVAGTPHVEYFSSLGLSPDKIATGYDVVDNDYFERGSGAAKAHQAAVRARLKLPDRYFLSLGRLVAKKNLGTLLEAYSLVTAGLGGRFPALVIVGSGPDERRLQAHCERLGLRITTPNSVDNLNSPGDSLSRSVYFYPFAQVDEIVNFYGLAEAFVLPSTVEEWGLVVNEAMASSLPVVVSSAAGCSVDLVRHGVNGFAFDAGNPRELAACLQMFVDVPGLSLTMGAASRDHIQLWGLDRFAEGSLSAFLLATGGG